LPVSSHLLRILDEKHNIHCCRHHVLPCFWYVTEQVSQEVHPPALPSSGLEYPLDCPGESSVLERAQELPPKTLCLAVAYGNTEHLSVAQVIIVRRRLGRRPHLCG
jgi:hypothetical protein